MLTKQTILNRYCCLFLLLAILLYPQTGFPEDNNTLRIIVTNITDAHNWTVEEAFFKNHPNANIDYVLHSEEQLLSQIMARTLDGDLVILPYLFLEKMEDKGYLCYLNDKISIDDCKNKIINYDILSNNENLLYGLPIRITQDYWLWNVALASKIGLKYPGATEWNWEDYISLVDQFPVDSDQDGTDDIYLMYGESVSGYSTLKSVSLDLFFQYLTNHNEFDTFEQLYIDLFRHIIVNNGLLDINNDSKNDMNVLLGRTSIDNPIAYINTNYQGEDDYWLFLPPPSLDKGNQQYSGYLWGCGLLNNASSQDLAVDFLQAMLSKDALNFATDQHYEQLVSATPPTFMYADSLHQYEPAFSSNGEEQIYTVTAGRTFDILEFPFTTDAFAVSQMFRSKLQINTIPYSRDFYDASYAILHEWLTGNINDNELTERMNFLLGLAQKKVK